MGYLCLKQGVRPCSILCLSELPSPSPSPIFTVDFWKERLWGRPRTQSYEPLKSRGGSPLVVEEEVRHSKQEAFDAPLLALRWRGLLVRNVSDPLLTTSKERGTNHQGLNLTNNQSKVALSLPISCDTLSRERSHTVLEPC